MSNLYALKSGNYVVVDFDNVTEKGLKPLIDGLKRAGQTVESVEATNRKTRRDGLYVKKAKLVFENGQSITLFIGDQGDIYQMTVNGKKHPVPSVKSERELSRELAKILESGQARFDKSQQKKAGNVKSTAASKPITRSLKKRAEEARSQIAELNTRKAEINETLSAKRSTLSDLSGEVERLKAKLEAEKAETSQLKQQINEAMEAMKA